MTSAALMPLPATSATHRQQGLVGAAPGPSRRPVRDRGQRVDVVEVRTGLHRRPEAHGDLQPGRPVPARAAGMPSAAGSSSGSSRRCTARACSSSRCTRARAVDRRALALVEALDLPQPLGVLQGRAGQRGDVGAETLLRLLEQAGGDCRGQA